MVRAALFIGIDEYEQSLDLPKIPGLSDLCNRLQRSFGVMDPMGKWVCADTQQVSTPRAVKRLIKRFISELESDGLVYICCHGYDADKTISLATRSANISTDEGFVSAHDLWVLGDQCSHSILFILDCCRESKDGEAKCLEIDSKDLYKNIGLICSCKAGSGSKFDPDGPVVGKALLKSIVDERLLVRTDRGGLSCSTLADYLAKAIQCTGLTSNVEPDYYPEALDKIRIPHSGVNILGDYSRNNTPHKLWITLVSQHLPSVQDAERLRTKIEYMLTCTVGEKWPGTVDIREEKFHVDDANTFLKHRVSIEIQSGIPELLSSIVSICVRVVAHDFTEMEIQTTGQLSPTLLRALGWIGDEIEFVWMKNSLQKQMQVIMSADKSSEKWLVKVVDLVEGRPARSPVMIRRGISLVLEALSTLYWAIIENEMETVAIDYELQSYDCADNIAFSNTADDIRQRLSTGQSVADAGLLGEGQDFRRAFCIELTKLLCHKSSLYKSSRNEAGQLTRKAIEGVSMAIVGHLAGVDYAVVFPTVVYILQGLGGVTVDAACKALEVTLK